MAATLSLQSSGLVPGCNTSRGGKKSVRIWVSELPLRDAMRSDLWAAGMAASEVRLCAGLRMLLLLAAMVPFQCAFMQLRTTRQMLGDTDRVLRPHHRKARAEKEGSCVGVAVNVEGPNHL